jgi:gas vesicle protein
VYILIPGLSVRYLEEYQFMYGDIEERRGHGFVAGLVAGTLVGAGLAVWFAPRLAAELRERVTDAAKRVGTRASGEYQQASSRVGVAVDELTRKGQAFRNEVADAVARGAHEVERYANAAKSSTDGHADNSTLRAV